MNRDEVMARIMKLAQEAEAQQVLREHDQPPPPKKKKRSRRRSTIPYRARPKRDTRTLEERVLLIFTPQTALRFLWERTVPPASENGLELIALYPELEAAAPALVADLALAFRHKPHDQYADHFARVASHHGLPCPAIE